jgi:ubiquinone/menaquinone biosynthesis C-methylase UbiE
MFYTIEESNLQRQQLLAQFLNPLSLRALEKISLGKEARILDLGCGLGETTRMLAGRFPGRELTGVDQDEALIDVANSREDGKISTLRYTVADALHLPFPDNHFDLVFTRYLLHHIPDSMAALKEMKRVCRSGGIVFAQEPDATFLESYPHSWAYPELMSFIDHLFADTRLGRKMINYFGIAGIGNVAYHIESPISADNPAIKKFYSVSASALVKAILARKLAGKEKLEDWVKELQRAESDPETIVLLHPTIAVWGIK